MVYQSTVAFAKSLDDKDPLKKWRKEFLFPGTPRTIYFTGNSLGLQLKSTRAYIERELGAWAHYGVLGHTEGKHPWMHYYRLAKPVLAALTGAERDEVIAMNHLTVNLHLLMISFYRPTKERYKIVVEQGAFASDQYAVESQVRLHGFDPEEAIVEISPRPGEFTLRTEDIVQRIEETGGQTALVLFGGIQYYTGQFFDVRTITEAGHGVGALVGFDLAHAIGNVPLYLHEHQVDFAAWCSYKYLNAGPGGMAGAFVHRRHFNDALPRLAGWWGYDEDKRFEMQKGFKPMRGVDGWQLSNYDILAGAALLAALQPFEKTGIQKLRKKSLHLTGYLEFLLRNMDPVERSFSIITPSDPEARGCQLSIYTKKSGQKVYNLISNAGVIADWRQPNVIRVAPTPLYNTYYEVYRFALIFRKALESV